MKSPPEERWARFGAQVARAAIVVHAPDTTVLWANESAARFLGLTLDEMSGKQAADPSFRLLDEHSAPLALDQYPAVVGLRLQEPVHDRVVGAVRGDTQDVTWGRISIEPIREGGELVAVVVTFLDDTELLEARRALADSEARFARAIAGTQDGLWEVDLRSGATWYAPRFEELLGVTPGSLHGTDAWREYTHPEDQARVLATFEDHLSGKGAYDVRYRVRHTSGSWRHVHARGRAERDAEGRPVRLSGALADITDQVRSEEDRRAMDARLEAAARLESLAVLAGGIAHDFNNLLTGVLGASDAARDDLSDRERVEDYLGIVVESAQRAADLTRQLLAYAGGVPLAMQTVHPEALVSDLVRLVRGSMPSDATLELAVDPDTPAVRADATQLHQVVMNLLVNAAEAVKPGGTVRVQTCRRAMDADALRRVHTCYGQPGTFAVLVVDDNGEGMPLPTLRRIFEPFYTTKAGGHGLGLAAVHGMIRAHGGYVDVQSQAGAGTRFEVGLPAIEGPPKSAARRRSDADSRPLGQGRSVLVVDDEQVVRRMLQRILESEGFQVYGMADGEHLEERLRVVDPDLLVLDVILPGRSGLELLASIRQRGDTRPVLLSSGHAGASERLPAPHEDAATRFLAKPYDIAALRAHVRALLHPEDPRPTPPA